MHGGLVVETGKFGKQLLAPLEQRFDIPNPWRFVLIRLHGDCGLSGEAERGAFDGLPPVPRTTTAALLEELSSEMLPALKAVNFERFSESLYRYGHAAGMCFAPRQGGPFASPRLAELVAAVRGLGARGVGQSSWGPTIFAVLESQASAEKFVDRLRPQLDQHDTVTIAEPNNTGAQIITHNEP
jgi:predicted sugar kinase